MERSSFDAGQVMNISWEGGGRGEGKILSLESRRSKGDMLLEDIYNFGTQNNLATIFLNNLKRQ